MPFRIIHIESDHILQLVIGEVIDRHLGDKEDYVYHNVSSLEAALKVIDEGCPCIFIVHLPDEYGLKAVVTLREKCHYAPIIVVTNNEDVTNAKVCIRAGADGYILIDNMKTLPFIILLLAEKWELMQDKRRMMDRYISIVEESPDWILLFTPNGTISFVNKAITIAFGLPFNEIVGRNLSEFLTEEQYILHRENIERLTPENKHIDGSDFWMNKRLIQWRKAGIFDDKGELCEVQAIGRDVTSQYELLEQIKKDTERVVRKTVEKADLLLDNAIASMQKTIKELDDKGGVHAL